MSEQKSKPTAEEEAAQIVAPLAGIDREILETAQMLVAEKRAAEASHKKFGRKGGTGEAKDLLNALKRSRRGKGNVTVFDKVFARSFDDVVLANRFVDSKGNEFRHLTLKKAVGMDGLRDIDVMPPNSGVGVDPKRAGGMNPEGRFNFPSTTKGTHEFSKRFNEAMNPIRSGGIRGDVVPEQIDEHFAQYATFLGYPRIEMFSLHPTVSNACNIPAQDAMSPGYEIQFAESEDLNENGIPDDLEVIETGAVRKSLEKLGAISELNKSIVALGKANPTPSDVMSSLAMTLERLAAYAEWEKDAGGGEEASQAVREGVIEPISTALVDYTKKPNDEGVRNALAALSVAVSDLAKRQTKSLDEVRVTKNRRELVRVVSAAQRTFGARASDWDETRALNDLAVAVERMVAYKDFSDANRELVTALSMALTDYSLKQKPDAKEAAFRALTRAVEAMDADEFQFASPDQQEAMAEQNQAEPQQPQVGAVDPQVMQAEAAAKQQQEQKDDEEADRQKAVEAAKVAQKRQETLDKWKQRAKDLGIEKACIKLISDARRFGVSFAVPIVDGVDYEQPFNIDNIREGAYHGFAVIEPTWIYPETESQDLINPMSGCFMEPTYWAVTGENLVGNLAVRRIHRSWIVIHRHKPVPNMFLPMFYFGGMSLTQEIYEAVFIADKMMNEAPKLAMTKRTTVVKGDINDLVINTEDAVDRLQAVSQVQDNFGILYCGRNADVQKLETSLSEFDQIISKSNQRCAAIAQMPETKLFKTQLAGMNSAGRYEWDDYAQLLKGFQENVLVPFLQLHYRLDSKSELGKVIQLKITFGAIDMPTKAEKEESDSRSLQNVNAAIQSGWLTPGEARTIQRSRKGSEFSSISAELPKELAQSAQQQQQGGMPGGMGGGGMPQLPMSPDPGSPLDAPDEPKEPKAPQAKE